MKKHSWTTKDDLALEDAVAQSGELLSHYLEQGRNQCSWWDAVAGRLSHRGPQVTGAACARRWKRIEEKRAPAAKDAWSELGEVIKHYEQELNEATFDLLTEVNDKLTLLLEAWEIEPKKGEP